MDLRQNRTKPGILAAARRGADWLRHGANRLAKSHVRCDTPIFSRI